MRERDKLDYQLESTDPCLPGDSAVRCGEVIRYGLQSGIPEVALTGCT